VRQLAGSAIPDGLPELAVPLAEDMPADGLDPAGSEDADPDEAAPVGLAVALAESLVVPLSVDAQPVDATATSANPASRLLPDEMFTKASVQQGGAEKPRRMPRVG
jgi:hypothetical protein